MASNYEFPYQLFMPFNYGLIPNVDSSFLSLLFSISTISRS